MLENIPGRAAACFFGLLMIIALSTESVHACACCSEPGTRVTYIQKTDQFIRDLVKQFEVAEKADIYMTEAGFDMIKGLNQIRKEDESTTGMIDFFSSGSFTGRSWNITLRSPKGLGATYTMSMPLKYTEFKVDIHDEENRPNGPLLYKEIRFEGPLTSATGFAKAGVIRGTRFELVFSGRGLGCNEVTDFKHWRLEVTGPRADYAFYGKLASGEEPATATR